MSPRKNAFSPPLALVLALTLLACANSTNASVTAVDSGAKTAESPTQRPAPELAQRKLATLQRAESVGTVFILGLILGMVSGVALFFLYLRRQHAKHSRHAHGDSLFDDWPSPPARGLRDGNPGRGRSSESLPPPAGNARDFPGDGSDEMIEQPEPWERSVDWWKSEPEE